MLSYWVASLTHPVPDSAKLLKELGQSVPEELLRRKKRGLEGWEFLCRENIDIKTKYTWTVRQGQGKGKDTT